MRKLIRDNPKGLLAKSFNVQPIILPVVPNVNQLLTKEKKKKIKI